MHVGRVLRMALFAVLWAPTSRLLGALVLRVRYSKVWYRNIKVLGSE